MRETTTVTGQKVKLVMPEEIRILLPSSTDFAFSLRELAIVWRKSYEMKHALETFTEKRMRGLAEFQARMPKDET